MKPINEMTLSEIKETFGGFSEFDEFLKTERYLIGVQLAIREIENIAPEAKVVAIRCAKIIASNVASGDLAALELVRKCLLTGVEPEMLRQILAIVFLEEDA